MHWVLRLVPYFTTGVEVLSERAETQIPKTVYSITCPEASYRHRLPYKTMKSRQVVDGNHMGKSIQEGLYHENDPVHMSRLIAGKTPPITRT